MANDTLNVGSTAANYNYAYTKPADAEQQKKVEQKSAVEQKNVTAAKSEQTNVADSTKQTEATKGKSEVKTIYEETQDDQKKAEDQRNKELDDQKKQEYLKQLSDQLNKKVNSFSENIKFGVNDKADSIVLSVVAQNNETKIKDLSKEDADKLFRRLDYVLGVLFDKKA